MPTVEQLLMVVAEQARLIGELQARIVELERQSKQNSKNSNRAPSGDRLNRSLSRAQQRKAGRKPGKQSGDQGVTLRRKEIADDSCDYVPGACGSCGGGLAGRESVKVAARQVVDIPEVIAASVFEHRLHSVRCGCGHVTAATAPDGVSAPVQYGPNLRALACYLVVYQHVPVARAAELIADVTGARPSTGWISSVIAATGEALADTDALIRAQLMAAYLLHVDETSINVNGSKMWLHVASTATLTAYFLHKSRGRVAVDEFGILPGYTGVCVHDSLSVYDGKDYAGAVHALCGAHIARELVAAGEADPSNAWPTAALDALYGLNTAAHQARALGRSAIAAEVLDPLLHRWRHAVLCGLSDNPRRAGLKQSKTRNLLTRLKSREDEVLRFARDLQVGFTNNQAERDLRPVKTQLKISGCHRSSDGARAWLRIRSYISTMRKNGAPILDGLHATISGNPWNPATA
ncbi:IS66 family transposase [Nocardia sp. CA-128927]|uniref:IS66 family transposase n=1 Tax=Nocardia sp. CA-128927 TaxID=3239975 RepID=UPI003D9797EE